MIDGFAAYRAIDAVNWSALVNMNESPLLYQHRIANPIVSTPAMSFGSMCHCALLEPAAYPIRYGVIDDEFWSRRDLNRATREGKDRWAAWCGAHQGTNPALDPDEYRAAVWRESNPGRTPVSREEYERALLVGEAVRAHPGASRLLDKGRAEQTVRWTDAATGIACKGRLDWLRTDLIADLKITNRGVGPRAFGRTAANRLYHGQMAFYRAGVAAATNGELPPAYLIAAESQPPFDVAVYEVPDDALYAGERLVRRLLDKLAACRALGEWPGCAQTVQPLALPGWALDDDGAWDGLTDDAAASEAALMEG